MSYLAKKHKIEASLFHMSNIAKIYHLIGKKRQMKVMEQTLDTDMTDQEKWEKIIKFLDRRAEVKRANVII